MKMSKFRLWHLSGTKPWIFIPKRFNEYTRPKMLGVPPPPPGGVANTFLKTIHNEQIQKNCFVEQ